MQIIRSSKPGWFILVGAFSLWGCAQSGGAGVGGPQGGGAGGRGSGGATSSGGGGGSSNGGVSGSGGDSASGGTVSSGGSRSSGGASGTGGTTTAGGTSGGGGTTSAGGSRASGGSGGLAGATGAGGTGGSGGTSGGGGTPATGGSTAGSDAGRDARLDGRADAANGGAGGGGSSGGGGSGPGGAGSGGTGNGGGSGSCPAPAAGSKGKNPLFTDAFTADPAVMVDNCTFYITCGHDEAASGQNAFVMREWFLLKSTDMVTWSKTAVMSLSTFKWANANAWAGQMIRGPSGKYYWYVPVQQASDGTMAIGVAVADQPEGPWTDPLGKALINDAFEMSNMGYKTAGDTSFTIDPAVFVDDDGQAYLQYGGFWRLTSAKLGSDMISINGKMVESTPQGYFESPYLVKRNGKYYEIYAAGQNPATIDWATSSSPMGPWTYGGRLLDAFATAAGQTDAPTNHAGVGLLAGQWYIAYHLSGGANTNGGGTYRRTVAVDKLNWNGDSPQKVSPSAGLGF